MCMGLIYGARAINCIASEQPAQWLPQDVEADYIMFHFTPILVPSVASRHRGASENIVQMGLSSWARPRRTVALARFQSNISRSTLWPQSRKRSRPHCTAAGVDLLSWKRDSRLQSADFGSYLWVKRNNVLSPVILKALQDFFCESSLRRRQCPSLRSKSVDQGNSNIKLILLSAADIDRLVGNPAPLCIAVFCLCARCDVDKVKCGIASVE